MIIKLRYLPEIYLSIFLIITRLFLVDIFSPILIYSFLILYFLFRYSLNIASPYFYMLPFSLYLAPSIYLLSSDLKSSNDFISLFCLGILCFSIVFLFNRKKQSSLVTLSLNLNRAFFLGFSSVTCLFILVFLNFYIPNSKILLAIDLFTGIYLLPIFLGCILTIAFRNFYLSLPLLAFYSFFLYIKDTFFNSNSSRIYYFFVLYITFFIFAIRIKKFKLRIPIKQLKRLSLPIILFSSLFIILIVVFITNLLSGGDLLIASNAVKTISSVHGNFQPFMPIHNGGLILFPDFLLPYDKPVNFNSSAWFAYNILNVDAELYPWGTGVTLVAASYLYGGILGVILTFSVLAFIIRKIEYNINTIFSFGFYLYFLIRIPYGIFRMDETFIFGPFLIFLFSFKFIINAVENYLLKNN